MQNNRFGIIAFALVLVAGLAFGAKLYLDTRAPAGGALTASSDPAAALPAADGTPALKPKPKAPQGKPAKPAKKSGGKRLLAPPPAAAESAAAVTTAALPQVGKKAGKPQKGRRIVVPGAQPEPAAMPATPDLAALTPEIIAQGESLRAAWQAWAARNNVTETAVAFGHAGAFVTSGGNIRQPNLPYPVASQSKAITALCLDAALKAGGLGYDTTLGTLADRLAGVGLDLPAGAAPLTIGEFVTHTSGMNVDPTFFSSPKFGRVGLHVRFARLSLDPANMGGNRGQFQYNNGNYAVLASVTEAVTGRDYLDYCRQTILAPAGLAERAVATGDYSPALAFAGWEFSAEDYLTLAMHWFTPDAPWVTDPAAYPLAAGQGGQYGLGVIYDTAQGPSAIGHSGKICMQDRKTGKGSAFVILPGGWAASMNYEGCRDDDTTASFERAMRSAFAAMTH